MGKLALALLIFRIMAVGISAIFLVVSIYDYCIYRDQDSLLLSVLWAVILLICIAGTIWLRKMLSKSR